MKYVVLISLILTLAVVTALPRPGTEGNLQQYKWKNRLVLVFAPSQSDSAFQSARNHLIQFDKELKERDVVVFDLFENNRGNVADKALAEDFVQTIRQKYRAKTGVLTIILIGKDGGEKVRQVQNLNLKAILTSIDAMPMRRMEMKQQAKK